MNNQDRLFVAKKPIFVSSNKFLQSIKYRFQLNKIGYSGILDPFASGVLVVASGRYTRLLSHFDLSKKTYIATLWLGAKSKSLDIENIINIDIIKEIPILDVLEVLDSIKGVITYKPPKFSAKKINGIRAYKLARDDKDVLLDDISSEIFDAVLLNYSHPFLSFKIIVSKGAYIRSIGAIIAERLGVCGLLSNLVRISEGDFKFDNYKSLNPLDFIPYERIDLKPYRDDIRVGKSINIRNMNVFKNQRYIAIFEDFFSIIEFDDFGQIKYILNNQDYRC